MSRGKSWARRAAAAAACCTRCCADESSDNLFCGQAYSSAQAAGFCGLVGGGYPKGSSAGLLAAMRFNDYVQNEGNQGLSSEPNVDIFLCSDEACMVTADMTRVITKGDGGTGTLALGYKTFPASSAGVPVRHIPALGTDGAGLQHFGIKYDKLPEDIGATSATQLSWQFGSYPSVITPADYGGSDRPLLLELGGLTRMAALPDLTAPDKFNLDWSSIRVGNYWRINDVGERVCASIVSFVHGWMDGRRWDKSSTCTPTESWIFDSYFPQALVAWPSKDGANDLLVTPTAGSTAPAGATDPLSWRSMKDDNDSFEVMFSGQTWWCDDALYSGVEAETLPGYHNCTLGAHYDAVDVLRTTYTAAALHNMIPEKELNTMMYMTWIDAADSTSEEGADFPLRQLTLEGGASIAAWSLNWRSPSLLPANAQLMRPLLKLAIMSTEAPPDHQTLPWCAPEATESSSNFREGSEENPAYVRHNGDKYFMYDCTTWDKFNWGYAHSLEAESNATAFKPIESGPAVWASMSSTWMSLEDGILGFEGYDQLTAEALQSSIDTVVQTAAWRLSDSVTAQLATTDFTLTVWGALVNAVLTGIAVIATYAGRHDVVHVCGKCLPPRGAHCLAALLSIALIVLPAVMLLVSEFEAKAGNPAGAESGMEYASASVARSRVVGVVVMRYESVANTHVFWLVCFNVAGAAVGALVVGRVMMKEGARQHRIAQQGVARKSRAATAAADSDLLEGQAAARPTARRSSLFAIAPMPLEAEEPSRRSMFKFAATDSSKLPAALC